MPLRIDRRTVVAFDLDDTLYREVDYVASGLHVAQQRLREFRASPGVPDLFELYQSGDRDPLGTACARLSLGGTVKAQLVECVRSHRPQIELSAGARELLEQLQGKSVPMALITDGRSITQRRKIEALGISPLFSCIVISEEVGSTKLHARTFQLVADHVRGERYVYVGDNPLKDVAGARSLGWTTVGLKPFPEQIHFREVMQAPAPRADYVVESLSDLIPFLR